ncbi:DUF2845 domain-containing protein [Vitiosangium sp. GDMCC 1.1324]|uniref:DUF2845 domain-containing protein n=1 Tax=Vitiosangium sp. (strain GDMCC 1.1324) TaxID=2138576 RepID=UPI000D3654A7|nr:DUF2845 domain-containing protein [Vitiosangium sp. GDMCC 1.1324]PTL75273.1 hypothetical protein DAT35_55535 [Vitiosangium sp. GDMCC 1.1324]
MRALLASLIFSLFLLPRSSEAATLRCGKELASDGASKSDVLLKCGEPTAKESRTETVGEKTKQKTGEEPTTTTTTEHVVTKTIEEWTYNFGANRLMQVAVFENGRLVDVRSGGYGR